MQDFDGTQPNLVPGLMAYSTASGPIQCSAYPRWVYHATQPARMVTSEQDRESLGPEWSDTYIQKDYPKMLFKEGEPSVIVNSPEEEGQHHGYSDKAPEKPPARPLRPEDRTLQQIGEAVRDYRRLSLDYVQLNQDLDTHADNVAMRPVSQHDVPHPQYKPVETPEEVKKREAEQDEHRRRKEAEDAKKQHNGDKKK
jgi:hypothetical protein